MAVDFFCEDVERPRVKYIALKKWIKEVIESHKKRVGKIEYIFCSDEYLLDMNKKYLKHDYYTDVITFDYTTPHSVAGDIFISWEMVRNNAEDVGTTAEHELLRILAHGLLHLTGQGDKTPESKEEMTRKEEQALLIMTTYFK